MIPKFKNTSSYSKIIERCSDAINFNNDWRYDQVLIAVYNDPVTSERKTDLIKLGWESISYKKLQKKLELEMLEKELLGKPNQKKEEPEEKKEELEKKKEELKKKKEELEKKKKIEASKK